MSCGISTNLRAGKRRFEFVLSWALEGFSRKGIFEKRQKRDGRGEVPPDLVCETPARYVQIRW